MSNLRQAIRQLRTDPTFTVGATLTLAVGIGALAAVFSVVSAVLLKPLPFPAPERLVTFTDLSGARNQPQVELTEAFFAYLRQRARGFELVAYDGGSGFNITTGNEPARLTGAVVSHRFFEVLGQQPVQYGAHDSPASAAFSDALSVSMGHHSAWLVSCRPASIFPIAPTSGCRPESIPTTTAYTTSSCSLV